MRLITTALLTLIFVSYSFQSHPMYTYVCKENGDIEFTGFQATSTVTIASVKCNGQKVTLTRGNEVAKIFQTCIAGNVENDRTVTVKVQDKNFNETKGITVANLIGGNGTRQFVLTCQSIPSAGVHKAVLRQFSVKESEKIYPKVDEVSPVDMRFKPGNDKDLQDVSELYMGDEFYLFLEYKGDSDYTLEPVDCTAYAGDDYFTVKDKATMKQVLWAMTGNKSTGCVNTNAKSYNLIDSKGFVYVTKKIVRAKLNAFHFAGNNDVTIYCNVLLKNGQTFTADAQVCQTTFRKRRRRRENNLGKQRSVSRTLAVKDKGYSGNSASRLSSYSTICVVIGMMGMTVIKKM